MSNLRKIAVSVVRQVLTEIQIDCGSWIPYKAV